MHLYLWLIAVRNVLLLLKYLIGNGLALSEKEITLIRLIYFIFYVLTLREKKMNKYWCGYFASQSADT